MSNLVSFKSCIECLQVTCLESTCFAFATFSVVLGTVCAQLFEDTILQNLCHVDALYAILDVEAIVRRHPQHNKSAQCWPFHFRHFNLPNLLMHYRSLSDLFAEVKGLEIILCIPLSTCLIIAHSVCFGFFPSHLQTIILLVWYKYRVMPLQDNSSTLLKFPTNLVFFPSHEPVTPQDGVPSHLHLYFHLRTVQGLALERVTTIIKMDCI